MKTSPIDPRPEQVFVITVPVRSPWLHKYKANSNAQQARDRFDPRGRKSKRRKKGS